jgi:hypothetical protein
MYSVIFDNDLLEKKIEEIRVLSSINENNAPFLNRYPKHVFEPLHEYLNESLIKGIINKGVDYAKSFMKGAKEIAQKVSSAVKDFSYKKVFMTVTKMMQKLKAKILKQLMLILSPLREAIIRFEMCNEENEFSVSATFKKLISVAKEAGAPIGAKELLSEPVILAIRKNVNLEGTKALRESEEIEAEKGRATYDKEDMQFLSFFERMLLKLGVKDSKLNGFLSEIAKKLAVGGAVTGIVSIIASFFPTAGMLSTIAAAIGGAVAAAPALIMIIGAILFGIGLFMFATWLLKPYPTIENCRIFLSSIFAGANPFDFPDATLGTLANSVEPEKDSKPQKPTWNIEVIDQFEEEGIDADDQEEFGVEPITEELAKIVKMYDDLDLDMLEDEDEVKDNRRLVRSFIRNIFKEKGRDKIQDMFDDIEDEDNDTEYTDELGKLFTILDVIYTSGVLDEKDDDGEIKFPFGLHRDSIIDFLKNRHNPLHKRLSKIIDVTDSIIDRIDKAKK